jgi:hypothetical protein
LFPSVPKSRTRKKSGKPDKISASLHFPERRRRDLKNLLIPPIRIISTFVEGPITKVIKK